MKRKELREEISHILVQNNMPTRQVAIIQIVSLLDEEPCCGHNCCCNLGTLDDKAGKKNKRVE